MSKDQIGQPRSVGSHLMKVTRLEHRESIDQEKIMRDEKINDIDPNGVTRYANIIWNDELA
jgi:hypothetical protein